MSTMDLDYYNRLVKNHLCWVCKKQDGWTIGGHSMCYECWAKKQRIAKKCRDVQCHKEKQQKYMKEYRSKLDQEHRCVRCGKHLDPLYKYKTCTRCRAKSKEQYRLSKQRSYMSST